MKTVSTLGLIFLVLLLCGSCSRPDGLPGPAETHPIPTSIKQNGKAVSIIVRPGKAAFNLAEPVFFDVAVANRTDGTITVPFIYNGIIEIDGARYTQFPKPKLFGKNGEAILENVFQAHSEAVHGTVTLGGAMKTVDAKTGKVPLQLKSGKHSLAVICGEYRSDEAEFMLFE